MSNSSSCAAPESGATLTVAAAQRQILDTLQPISGYEAVAVRDAFGRVLARDVVAPFDVPAHDNSAMDGFAVRAEDLSAERPTTLQVVGTALAGGGFSGIVGSGQAVRVMTGAVLPRGADVVVVQEVVREAGERGVEIPTGQRTGQNIRRAGEDIARGNVALPAGKRVGAAELGLLASLGIAEVAVVRRLRVAFLSTGDELASIGRSLAPGEVYDSNRYTLHGALRRLDVDLIDMGVVRDEPAAMESAFSLAAAQADVVITTGGVSVGEADFVKAMVARLGEVRFWKIAIKPGRPMAFGRIGDAWLFGLPGNPVAVMVAFYLFVADALRKLSGQDPLPVHPTLRAPCAGAIRKMKGRREFVRGILFEGDGGWQVRPGPLQGSGVLSSMSSANCFIVLPEEGSDVAPGDLVEVQPFEGLW
ncbi:MAG TPA: gephyrin-like molybdotransferase Glp [Rhodocyclaceae bacterium]